MRGKWKKGGENDKGREEEEEHLCQVVDGDGEEENQDTVEKQFAQTNQQASCLQTRLHEQTATRDYICYILNALLHLERKADTQFNLHTPRVRYTPPSGHLHVKGTAITHHHADGKTGEVF